MKNIQMKKTLMALILTMSIAGSAIAFSACNKEETTETKADTTTTTTAEETTTEEETEPELSFSDSEVNSQMEAKKSEGCTIEEISASDINADASTFVEGFKATGGSQDGEFVCVKFTDEDAAKTHFETVMKEGAESSGISTMNGTSAFSIDNEISGTITKDGVMCYYPYTEDDQAAEDLFTVSPDKYNDPQIKELCQQYIDEGATLLDSAEEGAEGFMVYGEDEFTEILKFENFDDGKAYLEESLADLGEATTTENADGSISFECETPLGNAEGSLSADGLFIVKVGV
ncbi:MAG: hypothetical protein K6G47_05780 [Clostridia bacterium]|nr:hypothetical protein [Clostridia bacterium]